jgi:hypothetical protein
MSRARSTLAATAALLGGLLLAPLPAAEAADPPPPTPWTTTELLPLAPGQVTQVAAMNNAGVSVGASGGVPVKWSATGTPTALTLPEGCPTGFATAIDEPGVIAGFVSCPSKPLQGIEWLPNNQVVLLESPMFVADIDDNGITVGERNPEGTAAEQQAFAFLPGHQRIDLPDVGTESGAVALTSFGYVVGNMAKVAGNNGPDTTAVGWYRNTSFPLIKTDTTTEAEDVNESGVALVTVWTPGNTHIALVNPGGKITNLDSSGLADQGVDINNAGIVLGVRQVLDGNGQAGQLYAFGISVRLDKLVNAADKDLWGFSDPTALNDSAWVVGTNPTTHRSWLLKPPPTS